jgi:hypothetical protein
VAGLGELEGGNVRASDRDRNKVADELRAHCADGRITVEEFERRVEQAMAAQTIHELAEVLYDLPATIPPDRLPDRAERVRVGPPGIRPFTPGFWTIDIPAELSRKPRSPRSVLPAGVTPRCRRKRSQRVALAAGSDRRPRAAGWDRWSTAAMFLHGVRLPMDHRTIPEVDPGGRIPCPQARLTAEGSANGCLSLG